MMSTWRDPLRRALGRLIHEYDLLLLGSAALLALLGTLMIYSATSPVADRLYGASWVLLGNHGIHLVAGLGALALGMIAHYSRWQRWVPVLLLVSLVMLILVLLPGVGHQVGGARRWLRLGFINFQPVELLKLVLIAYVASNLDRKRDLVHQFVRGVAPNLAVMGVFLALVVLQPDFGSVVLISLTLLLMIFVGGAKPGHVLGSLIGFGLLGCYLVFSQAYRAQRILTFLDPWADRYDSGFQIVQSFLAFGSGGWWGVGLGDSRQKMFFLPDAHTDFIFSILGEELGLVGVLATMFLLSVFLWRCYHAGRVATDDFGRYLAFGIATMLTVEVVLNLSVVMGLLPTKGLPLPFISYGGSSLVVTLLMTGVLLNIGRGWNTSARGAGVRGGRNTPSGGSLARAHG